MCGGKNGGEPINNGVCRASFEGRSDNQDFDRGPMLFVDQLTRTFFDQLTKSVWGKDFFLSPQATTFFFNFFVSTTS